jgi:hypothetical protein
LAEQAKSAMLTSNFLHHIVPSMSSHVPELDGRQKLERVKMRIRQVREMISKLPPLTYEQALAQVQNHQAAMNAQLEAKRNVTHSLSGQSSAD